MKILEHAQHVGETAKSVTDHVAGVTMLFAFAQWLPAVAAALSCIWYGIRIYEYFKKKREAKLAKAKDEAAAAAAALEQLVVHDQ